MPCYRPLKGYRARSVHPVTKRCGITFNARDGYVDQPVDLPCGKCIGCRLERSRQWAIRCVHEAQLHRDNCFITLTYDDEHLPRVSCVDDFGDVVPVGAPTLVMSDFQDFMKRLRSRCGSGIRFFHCGEYGEQFERPHFHACLFNFDFPDKEMVRDGEFRLYRSKLLESLWPSGFSTVGDVTFESAAYVARYITKKISGDLAPGHYQGRAPEYSTMSRRPGIGKGWFDLYSSDVYPHDRVVIRGKEMRPPRAYDRYFEIAYPSDFGRVKIKRTVQGKFLSQAEPETRLAVKEECHLLRFQQLKRGYEYA